MTGEKIKVLVVDDSVASRRAITTALESSPAIAVVGSASNGADGLQQALVLSPDVVTVDLAMPEMDGFTFIRMLMARRPTPIVVLSSYGERENVFRALDLGAFDFIVKPSGAEAGRGFDDVRDQLVQKVLTAQLLNRDRLKRPFSVPTPPPSPAPVLGRSARKVAAEVRAAVAPARFVAIGASTGGPNAIQELLTKLPEELPIAVVVAQHMPERFTRVFAERLNKRSAFTVVEAKDGDRILQGTALIAPGGRHVVVEPDGLGRPIVRTPARRTADRYAPSVDRLFTSGAATFKDRMMAIVLTGMGNDGAEGVRVVAAAGGVVVAESAESAVIFGMPKEAIDTGVVHAVLPISAQMAKIEEFANRGAVAVKK
ncbi:MAG: chemotaxis-specific protein-glutamate methyltransferase CheB [Deltaproteobacteria bacterium]|nr:chemotaxis-specific protein-glutamate methyltransferase CheB [Deltaproteobacteria bacterium]